MKLFCSNISIKKVVARLTEHFDLIASLITAQLRVAPRLGYAMGPATARTGIAHKFPSESL